MRKPNVLIVDDDHAFAETAADFARSRGFDTALAHSAAQSRAFTERVSFDLLLLDLSLPDGTGLELARELDASAQGDVVIVTGSPSLETAQEAVSLPIAHYLTKPLGPARLDALLDAASRRRRGVDVGPQDGGIVGASPCMQAALEELNRVASTDVSVLLVGESGTGKELFARAVHNASGRDGPFVAVNCGAVAPELLASQLFGHERGSFTGATSRHIGYFEQAHGGTLFLDEIAEMPTALQVFLLRVLESRQVTRVGGTSSLPVDVRVVSASNRDPIEAMDRGHLRADLFYRLAEFQIALPPLRARDDDAVLLARNFIERLNRRYRSRKTLSAGSERRLREYSWPGNVRELRSVLQRAFLLSPADEAIEVELPGSQRRPVALDGQSVAFSVGMTYAQVEDEMLMRTLAFYGNDKTRSAKALGISVRTVHNQLARRRRGDPPP